MIEAGRNKASEIVTTRHLSMSNAVKLPWSKASFDHGLRLRLPSRVGYVSKHPKERKAKYGIYKRRSTYG